MAEVAQLKADYSCTDPECPNTVVLWDTIWPISHENYFSQQAGNTWVALHEIRASLLVGCRKTPMAGTTPLLNLLDGVDLEEEDDDDGEEMSEEEWQELLVNGQEWKGNQQDCRMKTSGCTEALEWVREHGRFAPASSDIAFGQALSLNGGGTLADAFRLSKLMGLLAQESSFGHNLGSSDTYKGPFQLSRDVVSDFNRHNDPDVAWPADIDGVDDFAVAARVAAWYLAYLLQQLTWSPQGLGPITDPDEAKKFALAAYNGGLGTINSARRRAAAAGKDPNKWEDVRDYLPSGTQAETAKKKEIIDYVRRVRGYERVAEELECLD